MGLAKAVRGNSSLEEEEGQPREGCSREFWEVTGGERCGLKGGRKVLGGQEQMVALTEKSPKDLEEKHQGRGREEKKEPRPGQQG